MQAPLSLDEALLSSDVEKLIAYYEPLISQMAKNSCTQERATLNEPDMKQLGRMVVTRCFNHLGRHTDIRSFDGMVKDAIKKRLITERGKEFCVSRGRFKLDTFQEVYDEEERTNATPTHARQAYEKYNDKMQWHSTFSSLLADIKELLPSKVHRVLDVLVDAEAGARASPSSKKLAAFAEMKEQDFILAQANIQLIVKQYKDDLFSRSLRFI